MNIKKPSPDTVKAQAVRQAKDLLITVLILAAATGIGNIFWYFSFTKNIISVYVLGTLLTSLFTKSYFCGFLSSFSSVLLFNFCFTEPRLTLHAYERGYPVTFARERARCRPCQERTAARRFAAHDFPRSANPAHIHFRQCLQPHQQL